MTSRNKSVSHMRGRSSYAPSARSIGLFRSHSWCGGHHIGRTIEVRTNRAVYGKTGYMENDTGLPRV